MSSGSAISRGSPPRARAATPTRMPRRKSPQKPAAIADAAVQRGVNETADFGFERVAPEEKARRVRGVFESVAGKYDLMNDLMSFGLHRAWKRFVVEVSGVRRGGSVLDVAGGTADLARLFTDRVGPGGSVVLTDVNAAMLRAGRDRLLDEARLAPVVQC